MYLLTEPSISCVLCQDLNNSLDCGWFQDSLPKLHMDFFFFFFCFTSSLNVNVTVLRIVPWKFTTIKFFRINSRYFYFWWWLKEKGFCCVSAYSTTSPSAPYQAAVLVPAPSGCCSGQHPLPSVQPFPVPHVHAGDDGDSRAAHHVRTTGCCPSWGLFTPGKMALWELLKE